MEKKEEFTESQKKLLHAMFEKIYAKSRKVEAFAISLKLASDSNINEQLDVHDSEIILNEIIKDSAYVASEACELSCNLGYLFWEDKKKNKS